MITQPKTPDATSASRDQRCLSARPTVSHRKGVVDRSMRFQSAWRLIDLDSLRPSFTASWLKEAFPLMTAFISDRTNLEAKKPLVLRTIKPDFLASGSSWFRRRLRGSESVEKQ
jgi:hypothetical protein